ncbi:MAG: HIT family protein [Bacilli bacterium]|nr:HIT family protein [Bacilli bacterium]
MCVFCEIVKGNIPSYKVYEDDVCIAILDISQATIGHTLVIPKKHFKNIFELDEETAMQLFKVVTNLSKKISKALNVDNMNILNNNGTLAGQSVDHFHIHIIPRYEKDNLEIKFSSNKLSPEEFNDLLNKIK